MGLDDILNRMLYDKNVQTILKQNICKTYVLVLFK